MSENGSMHALAAALAAVQAELPEVKKTRTAKVEKDGRLLYTYDYCDLADASAAILPVLGKHGLAFTAFPGHQGDGKFGLRYWLLHADGGSIEGFFEIADQGGMQMIGGRITYARRYCLCAVTGIAAEDDVDAREDGNSGGRKVQRRQPAPAGNGEQPSQGTAQRRQRPAGSQQERDDVLASLPPLPGDEEPAPAVPDETAPSGPAAGAARAGPTTSGASSSAGAPASGSPAQTGRRSQNSPDGSGGTPGIANRQIAAIWTVLGKEFSFDKDERDFARAVCSHITRREITSTKELTLGERKLILDTLRQWKQQAEAEGDHPRSHLIAVMAREGDARDGEVSPDA